MNTASLAQAVLSQSPSESTLYFSTPSLPYSLHELISQFLVAIDSAEERAQAEEDENERVVLLLKALKRCFSCESDPISRDISESAQRILPPLLLSPNSPQTTHLSAYILNKLITTSPEPGLLDAVSRALSSPTLRQPCTLLQLLSKAISLSLDDHSVNMAIPILIKWIYYKVPIDRAASTLSLVGVKRNSVSSGIGGVMGSFGAVPIGGSKTRGRQVGNLSRSASRSSMAESSGSEREDEDRGSKSSLTLACEIRYEALSALQVLALRDPKPLHQSFSLLLPDSPYQTRPTLVSIIKLDSSIEVRLMATKCLAAVLKGSKGFLRIGDDSPTKLSFTSLSHKISSIVFELHLELSKLLLAPGNSRELVLTLIEATNTLVSNTPYTRLARRPLADMIGKSLGVLLMHENNEIVIESLRASSNLLTSSLPLPSPTSTSAQTPVNPTMFAKLASHLIQQSTIISTSSPYSREIGGLSWSLLNGAMERMTIIDESEVTRIRGITLALLEHLDLSSPLFPLEQAGQLCFLVSLSSSTHLIRPTPKFLSRYITLALSNSSSTIQILGCNLLAVSRDELRFEEALKTAKESEDLGVRSAACRSLGLLIKCVAEEGVVLPSGGQLSADMFVDIIQTLLTRCKDLEPVRASASWALANCCDILTPTYTERLDFPPLIREAMILAAVGNPEKIQTNGLRTLGSLLRSCPGIILINGDLIGEAVDTLCDAVQTGPAKVRWNAATAVSNTLSSDIISPPHVDTLLLALSESLLSSDNYKVRIHATAALMMGKFLHDKVLGIVVERVERAQARLLESEGEGKVGAKEVDHFNMLKTKLGQCSAALSTYL